jgi:hypothetical protein
MGPWHRTRDARVKQYENKFGKNKQTTDALAKTTTKHNRRSK